jgi:hypothetical protein
VGGIGVDWLGIALGVAGVVATVVALYVGIRIGHRAKALPVMQWGLTYEVLIEPTEALKSNLVLAFRDHQMERLSRTYMAFWNHRGDTIENDDVLPSDPLRLSFQADDVPVQSRVLFMSRMQIGLNAVTSAAEHEVKVHFEFLDPGDGGIIEILHQGTKPPVLDGTIRGTKMQRKTVGKLNPADAARVADPSWFRRIKARLPRRLGIGLGALLSFVLGGLILYALGILAIIDDLTKTAHHHVLIPVQKYDLTTLRGQRAFAAQVVAQNPPTGLGLPRYLALTVLAAFTAVLLLALVLHIGTHGDIPRSIVATEVAE